ncbi:MAG: RsmE family RNA methyltransferase [Pirellulaceae bacterium]
MGQRFFVDEPITADRAILSGTEAHHLLHVMRATIGDQIVLIDGSGQEFLARVERLGRSHVECLVLGSQIVDRELPGEIVVGTAWPKADRQRWLIEKLVEVGVSRVVPLRTHRSVVHPDERSLVKQQRTVVEASKQCGRNRLMEVAPLTPLADYLQAAPPMAQKWIADPTGTVPHLAPGDPTSCFLAIGPEGGWTDEEVSRARAVGWQVAGLGARLLRIETACLVLAALVAHSFFVERVREPRRP